MQDDNARFTILLQIFSGLDHAQKADHWKQATEQDARWGNMYIVQKDDHSELYRGRYRSIRDAQNNLKAAQSYQAPAGRPYETAMVIPLPQANIGPPELDVRNAKGVYTVMVVMFQDSPPDNYFDRRQDAVAYAQRLRAAGYEAYYHHGVTISTVCVGAFPASAVRRQAGQDGSEAWVVDDPGISAILADPQFEYLAVNGMKHRTTMRDPKTGRQVLDWVRPSVALIPVKEQPADEDSDARTPNDYPGLP